MTFKFKLPHYFSESIRIELTELYRAMAIADLAIGMVTLFEPIFLYSVLKFPIEHVLLFFAGVYGCYVLFIPFGAKVSARVGYKWSMVASIPFQIGYWAALFLSENYTPLIYAAPVLLAIEKSLFWPAFHSSIAKFANRDQVGREFSVITVIINFTQVLGPFVAGAISENLGVRTGFAVAALLYCATAIPLLRHREYTASRVYLFKDTLRLYWQYPKKFLGYLGFSEELLVLTIWPIFIYITIRDYQQTGSLMTISALAAGLVVLYIGKISDRYPKRSIIKVASILYSVSWLLKVAARGFVGVFVTDAFSRSAKDGIFVPLVSLTYERSEANHILAYVVFFEQSLAIGKFVAALCALLIFSFTGSFILLFMFAGLCSLLYIFI